MYFSNSCLEDIIQDTTPFRLARKDRIFVVQSLRHVWLFETPWTAAHQASLSFAIFWSLLKLMSIELVMPFNHLILSSPSPPFSRFQHQGLFEQICSSYQVAKVLELQLQHQSFPWIFRVDFLWIDYFLRAIQGTLRSLLQHHSSKVSILGAQLSL